MSKLSVAKCKKEAWKYFSLFTRYSYRGSDGLIVCYTCGKKGRAEGDGFQAGHWVTGHGNATYINPVYVRPQCRRCNFCKGGMQGEFRDRIRKELGNKRVDTLLLEAKTTVKYTARDYLTMAEFYKAELAKLIK